MPFDFQRFLDRHSIEYVTSGSNVAAGNINIPCPFCGAADPSQHMGINLATGAWGCWRSKQHRGRKPHRLIIKLLNCTYQEADAIVGTGPRSDVSEFEQSIMKLKGEDQPSVDQANNFELKLLSEFRPIVWDGMGGRFANYLARERYFTGKDIIKLCRLYNLQYSLMGRWKNRIIIPVEMEQGLVTWTGRSIYPDDKVRYQTLSTKEEKASDVGDPVAIINVKHTIYLYPELAEDTGDLLVVCEGPFDALKVDFYGRKQSVRATCIFSMALLEEQRLLLADIADRYDKKVILFDRQANLDGSDLAVISALSPFGFTKGVLPTDAKDPGELRPKDIDTLIDVNLC